VNSDVIDVLGYLACETVKKITASALQVKKEWELNTQMQSIESRSTKRIKSQIPDFLFERSNSLQTPIQPEHVNEAFRRLQKTKRPLKLFGRESRRSAVNFI
jgi:transcription initiation protein SPT3